MQLISRRTKLTFLIICTLFRTASFGQSNPWPYCTLPSNLKSTSLTYAALPVPPYTLIPNFRFTYKVTTICGADPFIYGEQVLTIAHPQDVVSPLNTYSLIL
ncbi:MAG TPA: hypothetical protein VMI35_12755, partial [Puia sp.]|nr:hypothetical protein [Puia sp.]